MQCNPFYKSKAWRTARRQALHDSGWRCMRCDTSLVGMGRSAHVHHRKPFKRAPALGTEPLNLMPLCQPCHNAEEQVRTHGGCDDQGGPIDRDHPWFDKTKLKA
jgi:hypothetical protein